LRPIRTDVSHSSARDDSSRVGRCEQAGARSAAPWRRRARSGAPPAIPAESANEGRGRVRNPFGHAGGVQRQLRGAEYERGEAGSQIGCEPRSITQQRCSAPRPGAERERGQGRVPIPFDHAGVVFGGAGRGAECERGPGSKSGESRRAAGRRAGAVRVQPPSRRRAPGRSRACGSSLARRGRQGPRGRSPACASGGSPARAATPTGRR
jgi:hypothetical protein